MHLTSGLIAFRKPTTELVIRLASELLKHCSPCVGYAVQLDGGRALALAVESRGGPNGSGEVSWLTVPANLRALARHFKRPLWSGFAEGGYANRQEALAVDAQGKLRWRSAWEFDYSARTRRAALYPLAHPDDIAAMGHAERAKKGYGRIGAELKADLFQLLSIERGDPLENVPFLKLEVGVTSRAIDRWLAKPRAPGPLPVPPTPDQLFISLRGERENPQADVSLLVCLVGLACAERKWPIPQVCAFGTDHSLSVGLKGPSVAKLSAVFQRSSFLEFICQTRKVGVSVTSLRKGKVIDSNMQLSPAVELRGGQGLELPGGPLSWDPRPLIPLELMKGLKKGLERYTSRKMKEEGDELQVIMRTGEAIFG